MKPPARNVSTLRRGQSSTGVWALQRFLNSYPNGSKIVEDGDFGPGTEDKVKWYQSAVGASIDGIVGPQTQGRIVRSCRAKADPDNSVPRYLIESLISGESGGMVGAVNWSVPGGVDCGVTQRRVYERTGVSASFWNKNLIRDRRGNVIGPNDVLFEEVRFTVDDVREAFDPLLQVRKFVTGLEDKKREFSTYSAVRARQDNTEYAWRLAALSHNWPQGAVVLAQGRSLSNTSEAWWAPASARFDDGHDVYSHSDWAKFYAMGSRQHNHRGLVVKQAFNVPRDG